MVVDTVIEDPLELSDEEFTKLTPPEIKPAEQKDTLNYEKTIDESESGEETSVQSETEIETDSGTETTESGEESRNDSGSDSNDSDNSGKDEIQENSEESTEKVTDVSLVDYKAEYEKLLAPFKANGIEMQAQSVDDAIQLMQMGAGFHKKMAALKPAMRQMKLLEKHGLLDDDKLNFLIDLNNKNPEAIQKLLKDSNLDPLDIDIKTDSKYTPTQRTISDTEIALDDVLNNIRETPTFQRTLNVISKEWDESSQNTIANEPQIIATINGHMQDGTFDAVMQRVEYERSLGRLIGVSDIQAYMRMGNAMADEGKLYRVGTSQQTTPPVNVQPSKAESSKDELERKQRKRAAGPIKMAKTPVAEKLLDPLELSDEDFAKLDINKYVKS